MSSTAARSPQTAHLSANSTVLLAACSEPDRGCKARSTHGLAIDADRRNLLNPDFQADYANHAGKSYAKHAGRRCLSLPMAADLILGLTRTRGLLAARANSRRAATKWQTQDSPVSPLSIASGLPRAFRTGADATDRQPQIATHASQPLLSEPVDPIGPHTFLPTLDPIARQPESGLELPTGTLADRSSHPAVSDRLARSAVGQPDPPFNTPQLNLPPGSSLSPRSLSRRFESSDPSRMLSVLPPAASGMPTIPITRLPVTTAIPSGASGTELSEPRSPSTPPTASRTARSIEVGSTEVGAAFSMLAESAPTDVANATPRGARLSGPMPSGTEPASGYSKVQVYYATDRQRSHLPLAAYELSGQKTGFMVLSFFSLLCMAFAGMNTLRGKTRSAGAIAILGALSCCLAASLIVFGRTQIEKHGVNYTGDRGQFTRGIAEVTIPDGHQAGVVERPSLLKFEVREDQSKHMVLTSAVELLKDDFQQRISKAVAKSPEHDVLVVAHGSNRCRPAV